MAGSAKITVKLSYGDDLRRLTVDAASFTFAQLKETVKRLYTGIAAEDRERLVVKYLDDEEDLVTISSDEELVEALNLSRNKQPPVLRLHLKEAPKPAEAERSADEKECGHGHCPRRFHHNARPWWARRGPAGPRRCPVFRPEQPAQPQNYDNLPRTRKDERHAHELALNTNPYGHGHFICDGCQLAGEGASYQCAACQYDLHIECPKARETANPWERRQQWFRLHQEAMKAMELKTREGYEKARELLKEQAAVSPFHRVTPLYNLACVEALLGDKLEKALEYLQEAVAAGWTDVDHIKNDADLNALRELDAFKALIASLEADSSDDDSGVEVLVNFHGMSKEERKKAKEQFRLKRQQERAEKLQARAEKLQTVAERLQTKAESSPAAEKLENKAEKLQAKAEKLQEKAASLQAKVDEKKAEEKKPEPVAEKKPEPAPVPAPVAEKKPEPAPAPVAPASPAQLSGSSSVDEFQGKLKTLEEMGFTDRRRNITALVLARGDLVSAVQSLLTGQ